jgi:hypothetical protein
MSTLRGNLVVDALAFEAEHENVKVQIRPETLVHLLMVCQ